MKRILFISFLFVILQSSSAFCSLSVDDFKQMEIEGKEPTWNEITQDDTTFNNWLDYLTEKTNAHYTMPSFSQVADLTANLLAYSVGNYADVASYVFDNLADIFSLGSDIWDFMTFNVQQMTFDFLPDFINLLKGGVDEEIYSSGSQSGEIVAGTYWVSLPADIYYAYDGYTSTISSNVGNTYFCLVRLSTYRVIPYFSSSNSGGSCFGGFFPSYGILMNSTYSVNGNTYYYSGWENNYRVEWRLGSSSGSQLGIYPDINTALAALWGSGGPSSEPTLNGQGIIVNDNPVINPVSLTSALGYPYKQTIINNYNNGTPMPWRPNNYNYVDYNYNYDVPFWEGTELETIAYPDEIEFPSLEFETVAVDSNIDTAIEGLSGWIIEFLLIAILLLVLGLII